MKNLIVAICILLTSYSYGQEVDLVSSTAGVFMYVVGNILPTDQITIERRNGNRFQNLGVFSREDDTQRFIRNYGEYSGLWDGYTIHTESQLLGRWNILDSLPTITGAINQLEPAVSLAFGIAFLDQDVDSKKEYEYRFTFPDGSQIERNITYDNSPFSLQIETSAYDNWGEDLEIEWKCPFARTLAGYRVYRSRTGEGDFQKVAVKGGFAVMNNTVFFTAYDTSLHSDGFFDYYVELLDTRGRASYPSEIFEVHTINPQKRPIIKSADVASMDDQKALKITWKYSDLDKLVALKLYRSLYLDRAFELVADLSPADTMYIDPVEKAMISYYYILSPIDYLGKGVQSPVFTGMSTFEEKPLPPSSVRAQGVQGGVKITWLPNGTNNRGFHVYRMEHGDSMQVLSGFIHNDSTYTFIDTLINKNVVETFGYVVTSESDGYVQSEFSDTSYARAILDLEIAPPNELESRMDEAGGVTLFWDDDMMYDPHVGGYNVYRKAIDEAQWTKLNEEVLSKGISFLRDDPDPQGLIYYYDVRVVDVFDIEHQGGIPLMVKFWEHSDLRGPKYLKGAVSESSITLQWADLQNTAIESIRVYRASDTSEFEEVAMVERGQSSYTDANVERGIDYQYYVTAVFALLESPPSEKILINLPL